VFLSFEHRQERCVDPSALFRSLRVRKRASRSTCFIIWACPVGLASLLTAHTSVPKRIYGNQASVFLWKLHSTFRVVRDAGSGRAPTWPDAITRLAAGPASGIRTATLPYSLLATVRASPRLCPCTNGDRYRHMVGGPACLVAAASKQREAPGSISVPSENDGGAQSPSTGRTARLLTTSPP
jgi:hypothetical protein